VFVTSEACMATRVTYSCVTITERHSTALLFAPRFLPPIGISTQADPRSSYRIRGGDFASVSATVAALENAYTDADLFEKTREMHEDEMDGTGAHELVHHIRGEELLLA
jgi:hypothetical protein